LSTVASLVLVLSVAATVAVSLVARSAVATQQRQMLHERTTEAGLVVGGLYVAMGANLSELATFTQKELWSPASFAPLATPLLGAANTIGVLRVTGTRVSVLASVGAGPAAGVNITDGRAALARRALSAKGMVTAVLDDGQGRRLNYALASGSDRVVYETLRLDLSTVSASSSTGAFGDIRGAVYASSVPDPAFLVVTTVSKLPISGQTERQRLTVGADQWLIITESKGPLVGPLTAKSPWALLAGGLLTSLLATVLVETLVRRRRYALALVDERTLELREATNVAELANRAKNDFLSRMSHELRTPLNAILGFSQLLELDELDETQRKSVAQIIKGGRHLLALINDILDISRIEGGNLAMSLEPVRVDEVMAETVTLMRPMAAARGIELLAADSGTLASANVLADRQRVTQIILNLVSNAIKYNRPDGRVTLSCEPVEGEHFRIVVTDTGPGISVENLDRLFVPFERLGAERTEVEGSGVGLALSRRLAEAMGGTVDVDSHVGTGSRFWVQLPAVVGLEEPADALLSASTTDEEGIVAGHDRRHKVLCIEDNMSNIRLIEGLLERRDDVELIPAMQGRLGLALAHEHLPALILLDLHLPDIGGAEVLRALRNDPATASTPVVILSADATAGQVERLLAQGATAYLTKPLDLQQLSAIVTDAVQAAALSKA
jgi:signal transduction histidine kinase/ActR/RegA family two-component response regulator